MKSKEKAVLEYVYEKHNQDECVGFIDGYEKCQEDMADKLKKFEKTIIDLHRKHGYFQGDNLKVLIREFESLNKQD